MSLSIIHTRAQLGIDAPTISVETHLSNGLPAFTIVGMPETSVKESKDRVRSALINSHFEFPQRRITVNLAPAELPKEGARFDLAIALGILAASEQIPKAGLDTIEFIGELALSGELRYCGGAIPAAMAAWRHNRDIVFPHSCGKELALCDHGHCWTAENLLQVCAHLHQRSALERPQKAPLLDASTTEDLDDIVGQVSAKRGLKIAASGGHNMLLFGPPGSGKSMLASRLPSILPPLDEAQALEVIALQSLVQRTSELQLSTRRPFRQPHHSASAAALVGGGSRPQPGEISLAHRGVLFLDELPEFGRSVLETLRQPLETGHVCISRVSAQVAFPARFQLIAAMNPCPCGYYGDDSRQCTCSPTQTLRYKDKISGPLLDRIDLQILVPRLPASEFTEHQKHRGASSKTVRAAVIEARDRQLQRQQCTNAELDGEDLQRHCHLKKNDAERLHSAIEKFGLSTRSHTRVLRVARTIADMYKHQNITGRDLSEALSFRSFDRFYQRLSLY